MPSTEARIPTDRASRYLTQLCDHTARISDLPHDHRHGEGNAMAIPRRVEYSDTDGVIEFDRGHCILRANGEELVLLAEADDEQHLRLMQDAITARLRGIGRRDQLSLT
ncbi:DUF2218 domain-containing protein [Rugosimonospora africana]|uniref:DUF2218 domain-containing protein n=1 Tax=Rugosimonospora africana TaxID=556532 RepID=A0A8J3R004_9ACTN|nr:DUF2218 domain-containing protein [Rugosimonospora africana]GIH19028.1 hypothetical protein Raf01_72000 [Rugosimonospora africana]